MGKVDLPKDTLDKETIDTGACTAPQGHCFGSDGGTGVPQNLKVAPGRGGKVEVWQLDSKKEVVEKQEIYNKCQYCQKLSFAQVKDEKTTIEV